MRKLSRKDIPAVTTAILKKQDHRCPLCDGPLHATAVKTPALDHDHATGFVRGVLCINCNGIEGKVFNLARRAKNKLTPTQWLANLAAYWETHSTPRWGGLVHPTHKTADEKRVARNAAAKKKRAAAKRSA